MSGDSRLFDTNAFIAWANDDADLARCLVGAERLYISLISVGELYFGALNSTKVEKNLADLEKRLPEFEIIAPDKVTARIYGEICVELRRKGRPIPHNDIWIAALARQHHQPLVSRDSHFNVVDGLELITW